MTTEYSVRSDFIIPEVLEQNFYWGIEEKLGVFNAASNGTIRLTSDIKDSGIGEYTKTTRFKAISGLAGRLNTTTDDPTTKANVKKLVMASGYGPIQALDIGPIGFGIDAIITGRCTRAEVSANMGQQLADALLEKIRNNLFAAVTAGIYSVDTPGADCHINVDWVQTKTSGSRVKLSTTALLDTLILMGDAMEKITTFVMPSTCYYDLVGDQIANYKIDTVAGLSIARGVPQALGRTVIYADIPSLVIDQTSAYYDKFLVLGLGADSLVATVKADGGLIAWDDPSVVQPITCARRIQWAQFDLAGLTFVPGSIHNATDAQLATASNWDENYDDHRSCPIVMGVFNGSTS